MLNKYLEYFHDICEILDVGSTPFLIKKGEIYWDKLCDRHINDYYARVFGKNVKIT